MSTPTLSQRLKAFAFNQSFSQLVAAIEDALDIVSDALSTLRTSSTFRSFLSLILQLGNYMNATVAKQQTYGFDLTILAKIRGIKSIDNTTTLLHYIVNYVNTQQQEIKGFVQDLIPCRSASRVESRYLLSEVRSLQENVTLVRNLLSDDQQQRNSLEAAIKEYGDLTTASQALFGAQGYIPIPDKVTIFHQYAHLRVDDIDSRLQTFQQEYQQTAAYFTVSDLPSESFFQLFASFLAEYLQVEQDLDSLREAAQAKMQAEQNAAFLKEVAAKKKARAANEQTDPSMSSLVSVDVDALLSPRAPTFTDAAPNPSDLTPKSTTSAASSIRATAKLIDVVATTRDSPTSHSHTARTRQRTDSMDSETSITSASAMNNTRRASSSHRHSVDGGLPAVLSPVTDSPTASASTSPPLSVDVVRPRPLRVLSHASSSDPEQVQSLSDFLDNDHHQSGNHNDPEYASYTQTGDNDSEQD